MATTIPRLKYKHPCACGCGEMIYIIDKYKNREHFYRRRGEPCTTPHQRTDRECFSCGSTTTYCHNMTGTPLWYANPPIGWLCSTCNSRYVKNPRYLQRVKKKRRVG